MDAKKETISTLLGIFAVAGGCTFAIMYTDMITARRTDASQRKEIEAMQGVSDALRERLQIKAQIISTLERSAERVVCPVTPVAPPVVKAEVEPRKAEPKPATVYVYRTKQAECRKASPFCEFIGCGHD